MSLRRRRIACGMLLSMAALSACIGTDDPVGSRGPFPQADTGFVPSPGEDTSPSSGLDVIHPMDVVELDSQEVGESESDTLASLDVSDREVSNSEDAGHHGFPDGSGLNDAAGDVEPDVSEPVEITIPATPGDVVISEFMANSQGGADPGEYIEFYNPTQTVFNLQNCLLDKTNTTEDVTIASRVLIEPGQYVVFARSLDDFSPEDVDGLFTFQLTNGGGGIALICETTTIDSLTYTSSQALVGRSFQKNVNSLTGSNTTLSEHWCATPAEATFAYVPNKFGTPGSANVTCP